MKILISGSSGFIGTELRKYLNDRGDDVFRLLRTKSEEKNTAFWDLNEKNYTPDEFEGFDTVINLSGENIFGYWTSKKKKKIIDSRIKSTELLCEIFSKLKHPPKLFLSASAIGFYGNRGDEVLNETSSIGDGFFPELSKKWEETANKASDYNIRVVNLRIGLVLSEKGGALSKMLTPFKLGLGGRIADGEMYWSWITIKDFLSAIDFIINNKDIEGPVNMVAPNPVTNNEFTKTLGRVLSRPTLIPVPAILINNVFGEMGKEALLASSRVLPDKLQSSGFKFQDTDLEKSLREMLL